MLVVDEEMKGTADLSRFRKDVRADPRVTFGYFCKRIRKASRGDFDPVQATQLPLPE
jgi:hypothetical protein